LSPGLSSPDVPDSFGRDAVFGCKEGGSACSLGPLQVVDVAGQFRCEPDSFTVAAGTASNSNCRHRHRGWARRREDQHALQRHAARIKLDCLGASKGPTIIICTQIWAALCPLCLSAQDTHKAARLECTVVIAELDVSLLLNSKVLPNIHPPSRSDPLHRYEFGPPKFFSKSFRLSIIFNLTYQISGGGQ